MPAIQVRRVPDDLHAKLKARAAARGQSLSKYTLTELRRAAERETIEEVFARIAATAPDRTAASETDAADETDESSDAVAIIREGRAER